MSANTCPRESWGQIFWRRGLLTLVQATETLKVYNLTGSSDYMSKKSTPDRSAASFIESMECLPVSRIPEGQEWDL